MSEEKYVLAIDEGTSSARAILFDHDGNSVGVSQQAIPQEFPQPGWVEQDPLAIWDAVAFVVDDVLRKTGIAKDQLVSIGVANQRETAVVWDRRTGEPVYNAITWQDVRGDMDDIVNEIAADQDAEHFHEITGLKLSPVWSAVKIRWMLDNVPGLRERAASGNICFGNPDSWVVWNLTGGVNGGVHVTDVTNASRTLLMDVRKLEWCDSICEAFGIPQAMLPEIHSSVEVYGQAGNPEAVGGVPVAAILGDQQAATFGQACVESGMAKCSYGTSSPVLMNTGDSPVFSDHGLATCVAYQIKGNAPQFLLENQILVSGSLLQWVRDKLELVQNVSEFDGLARSVPDNGDLYFVPAFSGLWAPYWRSDARGTIVGLTQFHSKAHFARAALEATAWQIKDAFEVMQADAGVELTELRVDGGMVASGFLMQFQADVLGVDVVAPVNTEATSWGAAFAAGLAVGFWDSIEQLVDIWREDKRWKPLAPAEEIAAEYSQWKKAVHKSFGWTTRETD